jgi:2-methylcitrate dehydratase PrpD
LAALAAVALPGIGDALIPRHLAEADALAAQGEPLRALQAVTRAYEAGVKVFETNRG